MTMKALLVGGIAIASAMPASAQELPVNTLRNSGYCFYAEAQVQA